MGCIFCKIIQKEIPSKIVFENERVLAFRDIDPKAPVHILLIPKKHVSGLNTMDASDTSILGEIHSVARVIAEKENIAESGYRLVLNNGKDAGQAVDHMHYHLLGGRKLLWPPG